MKRRGFLSGISAAIGAVLAWPARAGFGIFQVGGPGGTFSPNFVAIDGGATFYNSNGFTNAVNAGYDTAVEVGVWPTFLGVTADANFYQDVGIKSCFVLNGGSDLTLLGATHGLYWWSWLADNNPNLVTAIQANPSYLVGFNIADEPGDWITGVTSLLDGTATNSPLHTATNKTTVVIGKPLYVDFFSNVLDGSLSNSPVAGSSAGYYYTAIFDPGGNSRTLNLGSFDFYWVNLSSDSSRGCGPKGVGSAIRGLGDNSHIQHSITIAGGTVNIPTSFPANITFTTDPNLPVQIGAPCLLEASGGAGYMGVIGAVTAYTTATGACTIHVVDGSTYTAIVAASAGNGLTFGAIQFQVAAIDGFAWLGSGPNAGPIITDVTTPGNIPAGTHYKGMDAVTNLSLGANGTAWNFFTDANTSIAVNDVVKIASTITAGGTSGPQGNFKANFGLTIDGCRRPFSYGDMIDAQRGFQFNGAGGPTRHPGPIAQFLDDAAAFQNCGATLGGTAAEYPTPFELNQMAWSVIIHGGLRVHWFDSCYGGTQQSQAGASNVIRASYFQTTQLANNYYGVPNTISIYDQIKTTNRFLQKLAPVIKSQFVTNYVTVSPRGFGAPFSASYVQNDGISLPWQPSRTTGTYNNDIGLLDGANVDSFEVMAKFYTGATTGIFVGNKYWIFAGYRSSTKATNMTATFTIAAGAPAVATVTRFYMDCALDAVASPASPTTLTRIKCADTSQMAVGSSVLFENTSGFTIAGSSPNGVSFTIGASGIIDGTHIDVPGLFAGSSPGGSAPGVVVGTITVTTNINVSAGVFSDVFSKGTEIRIYRVN